MAIREKFVYAIDVVTDGVETGFNRIKKEVDGVEGSVNKLKAGWKGAVSEFQNSRAAQAAAAGAALKIAQESIQAASALEESVNGVKVAYGDMGDAVLAVGDNSAESFGMSERAFNDFAIRVSGFASQIAEIDGREVADVVQELTLRATDFASAMGIDANDAATTFMSTLAGETEPIRRFGKDVSAATVETFLLNNGLVESKGAITEADKVLGRYMVLMEETSAVTGDFANTSESLANQQKVAAANIEDLGASLGEVLIPLAQEATGAFNDLIKAGEDLGFSVSDAMDLDKLTKGATSGGKSIGAVTGSLENLKSAVDWFKGSDAQAPETWARQLMPAYSDLADVTDEERAAQEAATEAKLDASVAAKAHGAALGTLDSELEAIRKNAPKAADGIEDIGDQADDAVDAVENLATAFGILSDQIDDDRAYLGLEDQFDRVKEAATEAHDAAASGSDDAAAKSRAHQQAVLDLKQEVIDYATQVGNIPPSTVTEINALIDEGDFAEVERRLALLERARVVNIRVQQSGGVSIPNISSGNQVSARDRASGVRAFGAAGGVVNSPTTALIGEAGPEALVPLDKLPGNAPVDSILGGGGGGVTFHIGTITTQAANGDQLLEELARAARRQGAAGIRRSLGIT